MANQVTAAPNTEKVIGNFTKMELDTIKALSQLVQAMSNSLYSYKLALTRNLILS